MKLQVMGVKRMSGVSKKTGNDYDMVRLFGMVPVEMIKKEGFNVTGYGFELAEIELDPEALPAFAKVNFPALLDLETDSRPFMGEFKTVVVGVKSQVKVAA